MEMKSGLNEGQIHLLAENAVHLGYRDIYDFVLRQQIEIYRSAVVSYEEKINFYTEKYGSDYSGFLKNFSETGSFGLIEKEDDGMEWEIALAQIEHCHKKIEELEDVGRTF